MIELHSHLGGAVSPHVQWEIARQQGIALPWPTYLEFEQATCAVAGVAGLEELNKLYHWSELIQSSTEAVERSVYAAISNMYRSQGIDHVELRWNPSKRNRGGERDLDAIILAATHGLDRVMSDYPVKAGLIVMADRRSTSDLNQIVVEKAIKFKDRGIIGIDIGGPRYSHGTRYEYAARFGPLVDLAREAGLGVTAHVGEEYLDDDELESVSAQEMEEVLSLGVDRIGHGIVAAAHPSIMNELVDRDVLLEICPSSNLSTGMASAARLSWVFDQLHEHAVKFSVCTDGAQMYRTSLGGENVLVSKLVSWYDLDAQAQTQTWAREASFLNDKVDSDV